MNTIIYGQCFQVLFEKVFKFLIAEEVLFATQSKATQNSAFYHCVHVFEFFQQE